MYDIIDVTADAGQLEPMGSKPKFWFEHAEWGSCLFKSARPGSGEDWSEKLAEQLANKLGIPHAEYELAVCRGEHGIVTRRITTDSERLVHGNELLIEIDPGYQVGSAQYGTPLHTVAAVMDALQSRQVDVPKDRDLPEGVDTCLDVFVGYLLLDALIGNTDRHHENWAAVEEPDGGDSTARLTLSPTFDHASSMGRNEPQERMVQRLRTADEGFTVEAYARRARSALYSDPDDRKPLSPLEAFGAAALRAQRGAAAWCEQLRLLDEPTIGEVVDLVPADRMSPEAKEFVVRMVCFNLEQLKDLCRSL